MLLYAIVCVGKVGRECAGNSGGVRVQTIAWLCWISLGNAMRNRRQTFKCDGEKNCQSADRQEDDER